MIKKLRRSFVRTTMIASALVLVVLMGLLNILNYVQRDGADRTILTLLAENGGRFPQDGRGGKGGRGQRLTTGEVYEARFFTVLLGKDGTVYYTDTAQAPWIDAASAADMALALQASGSTGGTYGEYKYVAQDHGGEVMYIFLAWSQNMASIRTFFWNSLLVTALGLAVLFALAWLLADRAVRPIAESYEKQKSFITNAGHELKTPLAVIESSTEVIELESGESQWTRNIHGQVERLTALTGELVDLARMDEGAARPQLTEIDLSGTVEEALGPYALLAEQRGLAFTADIAPELRLRSNEEVIRKLCVLLADNAVKYTAPGGEIRFTLTREGGRGAVLREENPAEGLTPGKQERLFDRFYRGDESRSSAQPGYGLGLPLARSLAESLGGSITAHSPDGQRLVMTLRLN